MKKIQQQKGFTLVELAIVLTIIGLLIGGILKGQQLMTNARVTATIAQVNAIEAGTTTFRDTYGALPGDMANANARLPNCPNTCNPAAATAGDGRIGQTNWNMVTNQSTQGVGTQAGETKLFWIHLSHAALIAGVTDEGLGGGTPTFGGTLPSAKAGGGFVVGEVNGAGAIPGRALAFNMSSGTALMLIPTPTATASATAGAQTLTPALAAQMDRKMDDGLPGTGTVQAYGVGNSCYSQAAPFSAASPGYRESVASKDCGLYFRIQG